MCIIGGMHIKVFTRTNSTELETMGWVQHLVTMLGPMPIDIPGPLCAFDQASAFFIYVGYEARLWFGWWLPGISW